MHVMGVDKIINNTREKHQELLLYCFSTLVYKNITNNLTGEYV